MITEEEAKNHQLRNVITRSVGYQEEEYVDTFTLRLEENDLILLCSDGLSGKVTNREISQIVYQQELDATHHLIDLANERGGEDNITVVIAKVSPSNGFIYA